MEADNTEKRWTQVHLFYIIAMHVFYIIAMHITCKNLVGFLAVVKINL